MSSERHGSATGVWMIEKRPAYQRRPSCGMVQRAAIMTESTSR